MLAIFTPQDCKLFFIFDITKSIWYVCEKDYDLIVV